MRRTYKYRAKPVKDAAVRAEGWLMLCRNLYNAALEQRISAYKKRGKPISRFDQNYQLPALKTECPEFKQVDSQVLQDVITRLDKAYKAFFRRVKLGQTPGFPRFKGRNRYNSFTLSQSGWKLDGSKLIIRNVGVFRFKEHRPIQGRIKTVTLCLKPTGKWFVCFSCDNVPPRSYPRTGKKAGLDVGINKLIYDSDGNFTEGQHHLKRFSGVLRKRQRRLARRKKGSNRRNKARVLVAKTHERIANQRRDFLHKLSTDYIRKYDVIHVENLSIQNMLKNHCLARSIADMAWGEFFEFLTYKAEEASKLLVKVDPRNTSQLCSGCNAKVKKTLAQRSHHCPKCGLVLDRDHNAAINIRARCGPSGVNVVGFDERSLRSPCL